MAQQSAAYRAIARQSPEASMRTLVRSSPVLSVSYGCVAARPRLNFQPAHVVFWLSELGYQVGRHVICDPLVMVFCGGLHRVMRSAADRMSSRISRLQRIEPECVLDEVQQVIVTSHAVTSEERRGGKEGVSTCRSWWWP